jgi:glycosyltransferase involved in cell wall biosynthesis
MSSPPHNLLALLHPAPASGTSASFRPRLAIVIPAFNEERNLERVLLEVQALATAQPAWEMIPVVVNDGSTDATPSLLANLAPRFGVHYVTLPVNLGIGRAVQTGFRHALALGADAVVQLDGDGQHPAPEIPRLLAPIAAGEAEVSIGSRYVPDAGGNVSSRMRELGTAFFSALIRVLVGLRVRDTTSGFRAYARRSAEFIADHYPDDYPEVEVLVPLARRGFRVREVPVTMRARAGGRSSLTPGRSLYYMLKVAFAAVIDSLRPGHPDPDEARARIAHGRRGG